MIFLNELRLLSEIVGTNGRLGDGPVPEAVSPRGARAHLWSSVAEIYCL